MNRARRTLAWQGPSMAARTPTQMRASAPKRTPRENGDNADLLDLPPVARPVHSDPRACRRHMQETDASIVPSSADKPSVFRPGSVSYLRIPCDDARQSAAFYEAVFGWRLSGDPDRPSFEDGSGHVIGHFM